MTYEQRQSLVCQQCGRADTCGYVSRNLVHKCEYNSAVMQGWELGQEDARQQLMKDAVEARVIDCDKDRPSLAFSHAAELLALKKLNAVEGDRVKIIIIKEDQQ